MEKLTQKGAQNKSAKMERKTGVEKSSTKKERKTKGVQGKRSAKQKVRNVNRITRSIKVGELKRRAFRAVSKFA